MTLTATKPPRGGKWHFEHLDGTPFSHPNLASLKVLIRAHDRKHGQPETTDAVIEAALAKTHPASVAPSDTRTNHARPAPAVEPEARYVITIRSLPSPIAARIRLAQALNAIAGHRFTVESHQPASNQPA